MIRPQPVQMIEGPVGLLETITVPAVGAVRGIALICHPNPVQGGTNTNKVVQTLAKTLSRHGYVAYCPNLRGVGHSDGTHDHGIGEVDDALAVVGHARSEHGELPLILAGFSFGTFVVTQLRQRIEAELLILAGPACGRFAVSQVPADTLVIHGEEDEVIALADVLDWARPQRLPVVVIPGCSHFFHGFLSQLADVVNRFVHPPAGLG